MSAMVNGDAPPPYVLFKQLRYHWTLENQNALHRSQLKVSFSGYKFQWSCIQRDRIVSTTYNDGEETQMGMSAFLYPLISHCQLGETEVET